MQWLSPLDGNCLAENLLRLPSTRHPLTEPFPCLFMDDGGLDLATTLNWIDKGLADVESVLSKGTPAVDWGREDWGIRLSAESVVIFSMHDESVDEPAVLSSQAPLPRGDRPEDRHVQTDLDQQFNYEGRNLVH